MKKLLVSDYDGTFFTGDEKQVKKNVNAVKKWIDHGHVFAFGTGRDVVNMQYEYDRFQVTYDYLVGVNGAYVCDDKGNVLYKRTIDNKIAREIIDILEPDSKGQLLVQNGVDGAYVINYNPEDEEIMKLYNKVTKIYNQTPQEALNYDVVSVGCRTEKFEDAKRLNDIVNERYSEYVSSFNNLTYVNVVPKNISKATGIQLIADKCEIAKENVHTIGDNLNDLEMITCFNGAAMANGVESVKSQASMIVETVEEYIEYLLKEV